MGLSSPSDLRFLPLFFWLFYAVPLIAQTRWKSPDDFGGYGSALGKQDTAIFIRVEQSIFN